MVPPMVTAAGAVAATSAANTKSTANVKSAKSPAYIINVVVLNPCYNKTRWVTHKAHRGPVRKFVEDYRAINPTPLIF